MLLDDSPGAEARAFCPCCRDFDGVHPLVDVVVLTRYPSAYEAWEHQAGVICERCLAGAALLGTAPRNGRRVFAARRRFNDRAEAQEMLLL